MKTIVIVIPFEKVYPPTNGGMLRCFNILQQLCRHFSVIAITYQQEASFARAFAEYPDLRNCRILSADGVKVMNNTIGRFITRSLGSLRFRWWNRSIAGPANAHFLRIYPLLDGILRRENVQAVIFEEMSVISLSRMVRRHNPAIQVIYDAHNVNLNLARSGFSRGLITEAQFAEAERSEKNIFFFTPVLFACSENDLRSLVALNAGKVRGIVVPNGVTPKHNQPKGIRHGKRRRQILFCGSLDYLPNQEGLTWFCQETFPVVLAALPDAQLHVVGSGSPDGLLTRLLQHPQISYHGYVEDVAPFYHSADIAVVPLLSGSGTRLKLLEAMAFGVPVVSTTIGAEGIEYCNGENIEIADDAAAFAGHITTLLTDDKAGKELAASALDLVTRKYDWNRIGDSMNQYLEGLLPD